MEYVSLIKINGKPILPPLITPSRKEEIKEFRKKALLVEQKLKNNKKLSNKKLTRNEEIDISVDIKSDEDFSFESCTREYQNSKKPLETVPYSVDKNKSNVSLINLDVPEKHDNSQLLNPSAVELNLDKSYEEVHDCPSSEFSETLISSTDTSQTSLVNNKISSERLIRRNSYTLENPSPILLKHLKMQSLQACQNAFEYITNVPKIVVESDCEPISLSSESSSNCDTINYCQQTLNKENNESENSNVLQQKLSFNDTENVQNSEQTLVSESVDDNDWKSTNIEYKNTPSIIEVITTDIKVQEINITTPIDNDKTESELVRLISTPDIEINKSNLPTDSPSESELELKNLLQHIPVEYSQKILELVERTKQEQKQKFDASFETIRKNSLSSVDFQNNSILKKELRNDTSNKNESDNSDTTCSESLEDFNESTNHENKKICLKEQNSPLEIVQQLEIKEKVASNRDRQSKREWAASIIGAYVKGYLVRRLMKSFKVQELIQTIKDALLCAIELHKSDIIEEADVELHRRLIQQVSAACYAFHDVFFALTISEQMNIIAVDREKKKKALLLKTNQSSSDIFLNSKSKEFSATPRLSKSLTKV